MQKDRSKYLVFLPTYNERENIEALFEKLKEVPLKLDFLFLDDNSPDGTGEVLDRIAQANPNVSVIHRKGKLGIGSAHKDGIRWAYDHGYNSLITMDADFTHSPAELPAILEASKKGDVAVASRHMNAESLSDWHPLRKLLTKTAHFLTTSFLKLPYDATGGFRLYRLDRVPREFISLVSSDGYSFFFESLFILHANGFRVVEFPIALPKRTYGSSKMGYSEIYKGLAVLFRLSFQRVFMAGTWKLEGSLSHEGA